MADAGKLGTLASAQQGQRWQRCPVPGASPYAGKLGNWQRWQRLAG